MSPKAVAALGLGQLANWGVLYYAFAVLLEPVQFELDVPTWVVTGAFSLALLVSALMAPIVGRWSDSGHATKAISIGGAAGAGLLAAWALLPGLATLYVVWLGLGACMAACLYEPAFAIVVRTHASAPVRLRALALVTLFGGLASTMFLPLTAVLVKALGWQAATGILAALLALSACFTGWSLRQIATEPPTQAQPDAQAPTSSQSLPFLTLVFGVASLASASFITNLVPVLGERGIDATTAALLGGLFGVMQLPGRTLLASPHVSLSGPSLVWISLGLQAIGLFIVATVPGTVPVAMGIMAFAVGSGLTTLARPYLVQSTFAVQHTGYVNGRLARSQQLSRALGPIAASTAAAMSSQSFVLVAMGAVLAVLAFLSANTRSLRARGLRPSGWTSV